MIKTAVIGLGKMGISHLSILAAHPEVEIVGVVDSSRFITDALKKFSSFQVYNDFQQMIDEKEPEAVVIAVPTRHHASITEEVMKHGIHVFVEKPFVMNPLQGKTLVSLAKKYQLVNQVGYHNRFIGVFQEAKRLVASGALGNIIHFSGEAYGPVVTNKVNHTWRFKSNEGGGCLADYASHVIDLVNYVISPIQEVSQAYLKSLYSNDVEDAVFAVVKTKTQQSGVLQVNWSEDTYRKMHTSITVQGTDGKLIADATELKVFFKNHSAPAGYQKGWNVKHITELTKDVNFYLRGEEYSLQIDSFIESIKLRNTGNQNNFESALVTDQVIQEIRLKHKRNG